MTINTKNVFLFTRDAQDKGVNVTAADVAEALELSKKTVDGAFTSGIQRKGLGYREPVEVELEDGTHKTVKFLKITDAGLAFDPDAVEEKAAE